MAAEELEATLLGAPRQWDRDEVARQVGVDIDRASGLWAALGFAEVPPDEIAFTALDVEALRTAVALGASGIVDPDVLLVLARAMGQALSRLAEAQVEVFKGQAQGLSADEIRAAAAVASADVLPQLESLLVHVWRRHFAAATERSLVALMSDGHPVLAVGFVDLVGFTRTSRETSSRELEDLLERFERETALRVTANGGRVVKTLGDGVLFVADTIAGAAEVVLGTVGEHELDESLPEVRAGLALGPVLSRLGDVFGEPVNLASRLTDEARPSSVLVDRAAAEALAHDPRYRLTTLKHRSVRGYRALRPHVLRRA
ncbi:MAG: adenylate/guanylate cyclase domain-containing protein [Mycobacteriales bacterium]